MACLVNSCTDPAKKSSQSSPQSSYMAFTCTCRSLPANRTYTSTKVLSLVRVCSRNSLLMTPRGNSWKTQSIPTKQFPFVRTSYVSSTMEQYTFFSRPQERRETFLKQEPIKENTKVIRQARMMEMMTIFQRSFIDRFKYLYMRGVFIYYHWRLNGDMIQVEFSSNGMGNQLTSPISWSCHLDGGCLGCWEVGWRGGVSIWEKSMNSVLNFSNAMAKQPSYSFLFSSKPYRAAQLIHLLPD